MASADLDQALARLDAAFDRAHPADLDSVEGVLEALGTVTAFAAQAPPGARGPIHDALARLARLMGGVDAERDRVVAKLGALRTQRRVRHGGGEVRATLDVRS